MAMQMHLGERARASVSCNERGHQRQSDGRNSSGAIRGNQMDETHQRSSGVIRGNQMDETHLGERARLGARMPIVDGIEGHVIPSAAFQIRRGRQRVACDACILHGGPPDEGGNQGSSVLFSARQCSSVLVSAHQCSSVLISAHQCSSVLISTHLPLRSAISAHQCSSVLISAHQGSSARTSPCARQCRVGSAAAQTRTPSGRCRGRGDGRGAREHIEELQSSATQSSARQSSAIKRNQAQSSEIAPAEGEAMAVAHGVRTRGHTLC